MKERTFLYLDSQLLSNDEVARLKIEADYFHNSKLWSIMQATVKDKAIEKGMKKSKTWEDVLAAKMMLHNLGLLESMGRIIRDHK